MTTLERLAQQPLPGDARLTWRDLAEQIAEEHRLDPAELLLGGQETQPRARARHHLWGALRGAGIDFAAIARVWNCDPTRVRNGVLLASKRLGIAPPKGFAGKRGRRRMGPTETYI